MSISMVNIGYGNVISANRVIAVVNANSSPTKKLIQDAKDRNLLVDASKGRKTRSVIIMDDQHIILSSIQPETIANRINSKDKFVGNVLEEEEELDEEETE